MSFHKLTDWCGISDFQWTVRQLRPISRIKTAGRYFRQVSPCRFLCCSDGFYCSPSSHYQVWVLCRVWTNCKQTTNKFSASVHTNPTSNVRSPLNQSKNVLETIYTWNKSDDIVIYKALNKKG